MGIGRPKVVRTTFGLPKFKNTEARQSLSGGNLIMARRLAQSRLPAIIGTILVWLPIIAPIIFSIIFYAENKKFLIDFLIPAEIYPVPFIGSLLLLFSAWRSKFLLKPIAYCFVLSLTFLISSQGIAVLTGLASGEASRGGWQETLVIGIFSLFIAFLIGTGIFGLLLIKSLLIKNPD